MSSSVFASGTLFSSIFHGSPVAMTINALPSGEYIDVNDSFMRLVGYTREELLGRRAIDLGIVTPQRREPVVQDLLKAGSLVNDPQILRHRSGKVRQVIVSAQLEEYEGQTFTVAIIQDLTEYQHTQDALRVSEARFRLFFESVPLATYVFDLDSLRILDANPAASRLYGYSLDELRQMTILDLRPPGEREEMSAALYLVRDTPAYTGISRQIRKDGTHIDVALSGYTLEVEGRALRLTVMHDITEQLAAERALLAGEQRLQIITELSTDGIWDWDVPGECIHFNEAFRIIYGAPEQPKETAAWWMAHIHPDDRAAVLRSLGEAITGGGSYWSTEYRMQRASGNSYATVIVRGHLLRDADGNVIRATGALVDISRQMEIAEAAAQAALEERQRLARDLHDSVTQSLYSVTLLAEVARRRAQSGDAAATLEHIERLGELSQQCLREMRLLVYELRPALVEEVGLVGALRQRLEAVEQRSGVRVQLEADDDQAIPLAVQNELFRVAEEALNNALKHAHASSLSVSLRVQDSEVTLSIADNGRGFDPAQARASGGQGLSNMSERVARLGGSFEIDTAPGQETTVRARLRLFPGARRAIGLPEVLVNGA
jgi:PAS domain S-box-containing protein